MEIDYRPSWCPKSHCQCLLSYGDRLCVGRLPEPEPHDELFNTHYLCLEEGEFDDPNLRIPINDADSYFLAHLLRAIRDDIEENRLWRDDQGYDGGNRKLVLV